MRLFFTTGLLILATMANADVIKPVDTIHAAKGIVAVSGAEFNYSVLDQGWMTSGQLLGKINLVAHKTFRLDYESVKSIDQSKQSSLWSSVRSDADQKCLELGQIEYQGQIANLDKDFKTSFSAKIVNSTEEMAMSKVYLAAICMVEVKASK